MNILHFYLVGQTYGSWRSKKSDSNNTVNNTIVSSQLTFQLYLALFFTLLRLFSMAFIISRALMVSGSSLAISKFGFGQASFPLALLPLVFLRCNRVSLLPELSSSCNWSLYLSHKAKNVLKVWWFYTRKGRVWAKRYRCLELHKCYPFLDVVFFFNFFVLFCFLLLFALFLLKRTTAFIKMFQIKSHYLSLNYSRLTLNC